MSININDTGINIFDIEDMPQDESAKPKRTSKSKKKDTPNDNNEAELIVADGSPTSKNRRIEELALSFLNRDVKPTTDRYVPNDAYPEPDNMNVFDDEPETKSPKPKRKKTARKTRAKTSSRAEAVTETRNESDLLEDNDSKEEDEEIQKRIMVINRYKNSTRFSEYLKDQGFKFTALNKKSLDELDSLVNKIRFTVNNKDDPNLLNDDLFKQLFAMIETTITQKSRGKVDLSGMTSILFEDQTFLDDIERFRLEYLGFANIDYRARMVMTIISTALRVSGINAYNKKLASAMASQSDPANPSLNNPVF